MDKFKPFQDQSEDNIFSQPSLGNFNNNFSSPFQQEEIFAFMDNDASKNDNFPKLNIFHENHKDQQNAQFYQGGFSIDQTIQKGETKTKIISKEIKAEQKLKKNRQSAKMFRQKKKQYINFLQQKNLNFQRKILHLQTKLKEAELQRDRLKMRDNIYIKSFKLKEKECLQKIEKTLQNSQEEPKRLRQALDEFNQKFGSTGTERINLLNYHMSEIIQNLMNDFQKYFLNCFIYNRGLFGPNNRQIEEDLKEVCKAQQGHMEKIQKKYRPRLQRHLSDFAGLIQVFYRTNIKLRIKCQDIEGLLRQMSGQHEDARLAQMVIWFQSNKHRPQMNLKGQWYNAFKGDQKDTIADIRNLNKVF